VATILEKNGVWQAQVARKGIRKAASFPTKSKAQQWAIATEAEILAGFRGDNSKKTLIDALDRYASEVSILKKGQRWELVRIESFKRLPFAAWKLSDITTPRLAEWRDSRLKEVKASSVNREMNLLSSIFEQARREWQWIRSNPVRDVKRPKQPKHRQRIFSDEERDSICEALGYAEDRAIETKQQIIAAAFLFALETGLRREELLTLTWPKISIKRRFLTLETSKNSDGRQVPLSPRAVEILEKLKGQEKPFAVGLGVLSSLFRRACNRAGVDNARFHDSRATALTKMVSVYKYDVVELCRIIGHRDPKSLMIYYRESAEALAERMWGGKIMAIIPPLEKN
jgi:integrase